MLSAPAWLVTLLQGCLSSWVRICLSFSFRLLRFRFLCTKGGGGGSAVCPLQSSGVSPLFHCPLRGFLFFVFLPVAFFSSSGVLFFASLRSCSCGCRSLPLCLSSCSLALSLSLSLSLYRFLVFVWEVSVFAWLSGISLVVVLCFSYSFFLFSFFLFTELSAFHLSLALWVALLLQFSGIFASVASSSRRFGSSGYSSAFRIRFSLVPIFFGVRRCPIRCWLRLFFSFLFFS